MHYWGDDWPHWDELHEAEREIHEFIFRWTRCRLMSKEKYGTIRYERIFPPFGGLYCGRYKYNWQKKLWHRWYQTNVYHLWAQAAWKLLWWKIRQIVKVKPYLKNELFEDIACNEKLVGKEIHDQYWTSVR